MLICSRNSPLSSLQEKGSLAYLFSQRGPFEDIEKLVKNMDQITCKVTECQEDVRKLKTEVQICHKQMKTEEKGSLAYLFSQRGPFEDIEKLVKNMDQITCKVTKCQEDVRKLKTEVQIYHEQMKTEVVGYAALGMSLIQGSEVAAAIISLNADMFPKLSSLLSPGKGISSLPLQSERAF
ncbi:hypothetical protein L7F22_014014 [Adiantum nelumboides]|nr:hypothetical protein [Adiantum nelumboides]